jgi:hypothetical protein
MLYCHCFFNFAFEYAIRNDQKDQVGLRLNDIQKLLAYAEDVNMQGDNIDMTKKNTNFN